MSLKKAIVTFTSENGDVLTRHLAIRAVVFDYEKAQLEVHFHAWPSEEARAAGAVPNYMQLNIPIDLTDKTDGQLIVQMSGVIWEKIVMQPFIADFSELDGNGKMVLTTKSLTELGAEIIDVTESIMRAAMTAKKANK